jgi:hypothetical protein
MGAEKYTYFCPSAWEKMDKRGQNGLSCGQNSKDAVKTCLSAVKKQVLDTRCGQSGQNQKTCFLNLQKFNLS